jgi:hypothetical protein
MKVIQILPELNAGGVERGTLEVGKYLAEQGLSRSSSPAQPIPRPSDASRWKRSALAAQWRATATEALRNNLMHYFPPGKVQSGVIKQIAELLSEWRASPPKPVRNDRSE